MRRLLSSKPTRVLLLAAVVSLVAVTGVAAQDSAAPDLGSGWEPRVQQSMGPWTTVVGSVEGGFMVAGIGGVAFWSPDGLEWQAVTDSTGNVHDMAANDSGFVALPNVLPTGSVRFSPDGRTWESVPVGNSASSFLRVESGPGGFLLIGNRECDLVASFSTNGRDWLPVEFPEGCSSLLAAPTSDGWVGVAQRDGGVAVMASADGVNWNDVETQKPPPSLPSTLTFWPGHEETLGLASLSSHGEALVLAGEGIDGLWVSTDRGITWADTGTDAGPVEMAVSESGFVGVSSHRVLASTDGVSWVEHPVDVAFQDVAAIGNTVVATAGDGIYSWTPPTSTLAATGTATAPLLVTAGVLIAVGMVAVVAHRQLSLRRT